jgi:hypothetical protein
MIHLKGEGLIAWDERFSGMFDLNLMEGYKGTDGWESPGVEVWD